MMSDSKKDSRSPNGDAPEEETGSETEAPAKAPEEETETEAEETEPEEETEAEAEEEEEPEEEEEEDEDEDEEEDESEPEEEFFAEEEGSAPAVDEDDFDPELLKIPKPKRRRHPIVSLIVIGFSLYLMYFMRTDILFFFQPRTPVVVGHVSQALKQGKLQPNSHVRLEGVPDRKRTGRLEVSFGHDNFFPLLQSNNKVFVQQHVSRNDPDREVRFTHSGQLVLLESLPYRKNLKQFLGQAISKSHALDVATLRAGRLGAVPATTLKDRDGEQVKMNPDTLLWINAAYAGEWLIQFNRHKCPDDERALKQLLGHKLPVAQDSEKSRIFWRLVARADAEQFGKVNSQFRACRKRLAAKSPFRKPPVDAAAAGQVKAVDAGAVESEADLKCCAAGELVPRVLAFTGRWDQISFKGDQLLIDSRDDTFPTRYVMKGDKLEALKEKVVRLPVSALRSIETSSKYEVPADALVLLTNKKPDDHWYYALLYLVLLSFMALNGWILYVRFRTPVEE